ncbi:hypothetical protein VTK26DRAFT_2699 [Humicola hyalothermophila]
MTSASDCDGVPLLNRCLPPLGQWTAILGMMLVAILTGLPVAIFLVLGIYLIWRKLQEPLRNKRKRRQQAEAEIRTCSPCPVMPKTGFLGFGRLWGGIKANKVDRGPHYVVETMDAEMGKDVHTCIVPIHDYELIVTREPENVQAILATNSQDWDVGEHRVASWIPLVGKGVFTTRGEDWHKSRALVRPHFRKDLAADLDSFERHVDRMMRVIDVQFGVGSATSYFGWTDEFDLQLYLNNMVLDLVTEMIFGSTVCTQDYMERRPLPELPGVELPDRVDIGEHMDAGKAWIETRGAFWKYRWLLPARGFYKHCEAIHRFANWFVQLRLQKGDAYLEALEDVGPSIKNLHETEENTKRRLEQARLPTDRFVLLNELAKTTQDPDELRSQTLNVFLAARDTTAALLGWLFYFLSRHQTVQAKLRKEILDQFGPWRNACHHEAGRPTGIQVKQLQVRTSYLGAVINETLRMAPVVPLNERVALCDTVLPRGGGFRGQEKIFVPKGTQVLIPIYALGRRKGLWGHDVNEFRPGRWLENGGRRFGFEFIPFGGGARQCMGRECIHCPSGCDGGEVY